MVPIPYLRDVVPLGLLAEMLTSGYVRQQVHPTEPLTILNYTDAAAYEGVWNAVTRQCRGLIYRTETGEVVARPFPKFMNYGQAGAPDLALDESVTVTDKLDGSLGILYRAADGWAIATRGSFTSEQAIHATALFRDRYADWEPPRGFTCLFEIIYPENRIVCDYAGLDDLVLLGAVRQSDGRSMTSRSTAWWFEWPGPVAEEFPYGTLAEALAAPVRPGREGLVVHARRLDERVKLKQADYVALHRIVTGLSARTVWQHLVDGKPLAELIAPLPDEFGPWVQDVADDLELHVEAESRRLLLAYARVLARMPEGWQPGDRAGRAAFAKLAGPHPDRWALFALLDGRNLRPTLLRNAKPDAYHTPAGRRFGEDTA